MTATTTSAAGGIAAPLANQLPGMIGIRGERRARRAPPDATSSHSIEEGPAP